MVASTTPKAFRMLKMTTPMVDPARPPMSINVPSFVSTCLSRQWAETPAIDVARIWLAWVETATAAGMP